MSADAKIPGSAEAWEEGRLGLSDKHVRRADEGTSARVDEALGLQAISIRIPKAVIDTYKLLAGIHGVGYQPLMRDALCRFAEAEMKQLLLGAAECARQERKAASAENETPDEAAGTAKTPRRMKKAA